MEKSNHTGEAALKRPFPYLIFDSHLGSGSSRIAAYGLGFDFYATEIDEEYFEAQEERFHRECFGEIKTERGTLVQTNLFDRE